MQASISPKKYIETRVRTLPIYKCFVNADWETSSMANIIIMRQHVNGHVSGGVYLVDLLCLGVKETIWFFNEDEAEMMERFTGDGTIALETIDYELAHNIVYAGHDFAMDYDIHPHTDFKTSKFVLEEDDDQIPLVDIKTGYGEDGIPHLMANQPGQYAEALSKLKKNAGEGNYIYTVAFDSDMDDSNEYDRDGNVDDEMEEDDNIELLSDIINEDATMSLSDFPDGELTLENVQQVISADLADEDKVGARNTMDKTICLTEMMLRILPPDFYNNEQEWAEVEWDELEKAVDLPNGITEAEFDEWKKIVEKSNTSNEDGDDQVIAMQQLSEKMELQYSHNPFVATMLVADAIFADDETAKELILKWQPQHGHLPLFQLLYAFYVVLKNELTENLNSIIENNNLKDAFPDTENFNELEFAIFHALQCIKYCKLQRLPEAVQHYHLTAATGIVHILFMPMMEELLPLLQANALKQVTDINDKLDNLDDVV